MLLIRFVPVTVRIGQNILNEVPMESSITIITILKALMDFLMGPEKILCMDQKPQKRTTKCQHENCFFIRFTNLLHAECGKFYNFIWKMTNFKQIGNGH